MASMKVISKLSLMGINNLVLFHLTTVQRKIEQNLQTKTIWVQTEKP
jgi:hypothetical protein